MARTQVTVSDEDIQEPNEGGTDEQQGGTNDEPTKLAGKFDSPEALEQAYLELQRKFTKERQGQPNDDPDDDDDSGSDERRGLRIEKREKPEDDAEGAGIDLDALYKEYVENDRALPEETLENLRKAGLKPEQVQSLMAGRDALVEKAEAEVAESVGGRKALNQLMDWARENLSQPEIEAYNAAVDTDNTELVKMLLAGMKARYESQVGRDPKFVDAEPTRSTGIKPFASTEELMDAMSNPKYKTDPAYRNMVMKRLEVTDM